MARVTVEDCVAQVPNRFELVLIAAKRARKLTTGASQTVLEWENDKATVLALREIAAGYKFNDEEDAEVLAAAELAAAELASSSKPETTRNILGSDDPFAT